jgi:hypothetical protein
MKFWGFGLTAGSIGRCLESLTRFEYTPKVLSDQAATAELS